MDSELTAIRDAFYVGRFAHGRDLVTSLRNSAQWPTFDSLSKSEIDEWELKLALAAGLSTSIADEQTTTVLRNVAEALHPLTADEQRKTAWLTLKGLTTPRNPALRALTVYTIGCMTLTGQLLSQATEVGDLNSILSELCQCQSTEAMMLEMLILVLSDRVDMATKVFSKLLLTSDDSTLPTLAQVWNAMIKGAWHEAFLSLGDLENLLNIQSGDDVPAFLDHLKGVTLIHQSLFEEATLTLTKVVEATQDPVAIMNLVCALQNTGKVAEAEMYTQKLRSCLPPSHPYSKVLSAYDQVVQSVCV